MSIVVSDTSPLHYLILCGEERILPVLFDEVLVPPTVFAEMQHPRTPPHVREWCTRIPDWLKVRTPSSLDPTLNLDPGETEAICLAREVNATALLIDDHKGRNVALRLGLQVTGTLGLLEVAADRRLIDLPATISKLRKTNARLDDELVQAILRRNRSRGDELP